MLVKILNILLLLVAQMLFPMLMFRLTLIIIIKEFITKNIAEVFQKRAECKETRRNKSIVFSNSTCVKKPSCNTNRLMRTAC